MTTEEPVRRNAAHEDDLEAALAKVAEAVRAIEYGSVLVTIHQGEVVGIETSTKLRLRPAKRSS